MEVLHHAIMSEQWARDIGCDDKMAREITFWSMMPDISLAVIGYQHRGLSHMEDDPSILGSQLHHTASDLSLLYISPHVPVLPEMACVAKVGLHLHLVQDREYDRWISRYISASRDGQEQWAYHRRDNGRSISTQEISLVKRWSWRCAWMDTIGEHLSEAELSGEEYPRLLNDNYIVPARENRYWHPAMESKIRELWGVEMIQEHLPESMEDLEEDMLAHLVCAWEAWKVHFR